MQVVVVPPNKPCVRVDHPWQPFRTDGAAAEERARIVQQALTSRRPLLIGTSSTSASIQIYHSVLETVQQEQAAMEAAVRRQRLVGMPHSPSPRRTRARGPGVSGVHPDMFPQHFKKRYP